MLPLAAMQPHAGRPAPAQQRNRSDEGVLLCWGALQVRFVVMGNVFPTEVALHRKYDLKGSTHGRTAGPRALEQPGAVLKVLACCGCRPLCSLQGLRAPPIWQVSLSQTWRSMCSWLGVTGVHAAPCLKPEGGSCAWK